VQRRLSSIFRQKEALSLNYQPDNLLHRDEETKSIEEILDDVRNGIPPRNIMVLGAYGSGKTVVCKHASKELERKSSLQELTVASAYVNCGALADTHIRIMRELLRSINSPFAKPGLSGNDYASAVKNEAKRFSCWIVVLDEVDKLIDKRNAESKRSEADSLFYFLSREVTNLSVIMITNQATIWHKLDDALDSRTRDTFKSVPVEFGEYDLQQLRDILRARFAKALQPSAYNETIINLIAGISTRKCLGARGLIDLARLAAEHAERSGCNQITEDHVRAAELELDRTEPIKIISTLPAPRKEILQRFTERCFEMSSVEFGKWFQKELAPKYELGSSYSAQNRLVKPLLDLEILREEKRGLGRGQGSVTRMFIPPHMRDVVLKGLATTPTLARKV
jgi:cell division control protein 6